jgi:hypothetical protein
VNGEKATNQKRRLRRERRILSRNESKTVWSVNAADGFIAVTGNGPNSENNARFIADARDLFLALVQEVRVLNERLARTTEELRQANAYIKEMLPPLLPEE